MSNAREVMDFYFGEVSRKYKVYRKSREMLEMFVNDKLKEGLTVEQLKTKLLENHESVDAWLASRASLEPENLIEVGKYYLHSRLREKPKPIRAEQDDDGNTVWHNLNSYDGPTMLEVYTLTDLLNDYYRTLNTPEYLRDHNRDKGALKYLVNQFGLDMVQFMIDAAQGAMEDDDDVIVDPLKMKPFLRQAKERYNFKLTLLKEAGEDFELDS